MRSVLLCVCALAVTPAVVLRAEVTVPACFSDHMVLQRDQPIPVWGWDAPGTAVTVRLGETVQTTAANEQGAWRVDLPPQSAGGPWQLVVEGSSVRQFADVLVGEVWFCSGQSNMEWPVRASSFAEQEIAAANFPQIRHLKVEHRPAKTPVADVPANGWRVCSPETAGDFTAVGYFFARELQRELNVPIGLIGCNWGGTRIEPWTPPIGFESTPALADIAGKLAELPEVNAEGNVNHQSPLALYNGMVHPLVPYAIRGALWYQGESNNGEGMLYFEKMRALIAGWRAVWQRPDMPFYFVQLAPFRYQRDPADLAGIWEAQAAALDLPHTGMAATTDIATLNDIHPPNKQDVGRRLALWALAHDYGREDLVYCGPCFHEAIPEGDALRVRFDHADGGLATRDGEPPTWFEVAGATGDYVAAAAQIDGQELVLRADGVAAPRRVRFGWSQEAEPNLVNGAGLPALPFRSE